MLIKKILLTSVFFVASISVSSSHANRSLIGTLNVLCNPAVHNLSVKTSTGTVSSAQLQQLVGSLDNCMSGDWKNIYTIKPYKAGEPQLVLNPAIGSGQEEEKTLNRIALKEKRIIILGGEVERNNQLLLSGGVDYQAMQPVTKKYDAIVEMQQKPVQTEPQYTNTYTHVPK